MSVINRGLSLTVILCYTLALKTTFKKSFTGQKEQTKWRLSQRGQSLETSTHVWQKIHLFPQRYFVRIMLSPFLSKWVLYFATAAINKHLLLSFYSDVGVVLYESVKEGKKDLKCHSVSLERHPPGIQSAQLGSYRLHTGRLHLAHFKSLLQMQRPKMTSKLQRNKSYVYPQNNHLTFYLLYKMALKFI